MENRPAVFVHTAQVSEVVYRNGVRRLLHLQSELGDDVVVSGLRDPDGNIIYETYYDALLGPIVSLNDVATLKKYIEIKPRGPLFPKEAYWWEPRSTLLRFTEARKHLAYFLIITTPNPILPNPPGREPKPTEEPNKRRFYLLNTACFGANPETACFLMDRKPPLGSVNDTDPFGDTAPLHAAASLAKNKFSGWMNRDSGYDGYRGRELVLASDIPETEPQEHIIDTFKLLLEVNPDSINAQDKEGATPLHYATASHVKCGAGHSYAVIKFLFDNKADANLAKSQGQTVLHILASPSLSGVPIDLTMIDLLLMHGTDIGRTNLDGNTALHIIVRAHPQTETVRYLLSKGADVTAINSKGNTPLHEVMGGWFLLLEDHKGGACKRLALADRFKAQDDMIAVLKESKDLQQQLDGTSECKRQNATTAA
ncbi:ankyrin repeat-containing protein, putative [Talaromyces stipitatus ATCC 10500]|uniref:Ankyrin repeat-containing protein, putative n=1 Tax=Talaromyces stipitatus (strain ATCC 10500 / CBS 375.48 / QM 6759 / NRRL 1006) TaxID=441959 RepID=B8M1C3_TALSN|nr:ankyrin repeat-containing protein, putative [Talaromyces stipitatus ATCC 10500]EED21819.1 ankyrin repeat-containing protein, putative [Talaromyces stipitatus ATCC 10500]